jgi:hypothetical protein
MSPDHVICEQSGSVYDTTNALTSPFSKVRRATLLPGGRSEISTTLMRYADAARTEPQILQSGGSAKIHVVKMETESRVKQYPTIAQGALLGGQKHTIQKFAFGWGVPKILGPLKRSIAGPHYAT